MNLEGIYTKTYRDLLLTQGEFNVRHVVMLAFFNCPDEYTKATVKRIAIKVLDEGLERGMVKVLNEDCYESIFSKQNIR